VQTNIQPNSSIVYTAHASQPRIEMNQPIFQPQQQQEQQLKRDEDISMLLFILGFLCHWIWLIAYLKYRNSPAPRAQMFARYSRNIFMLFIIFAVTLLLIWCLILSHHISGWK
jgi:lipopolysaccharide/colanic/teichoic acid biosynthesis glycosyltransferase